MCKLSVFHIALIVIFVRDSWTYDYFDEEYNDPTISAESGTNEIRSEEDKYLPQNHRDSGNYVEVKILNRDYEKENRTESVEIEVVANSTDRNIDVYVDDGMYFILFITRETLSVFSKFSLYPIIFS